MSGPDDTGSSWSGALSSGAGAVKDLKAWLHDAKADMADMARQSKDFAKNMTAVGGSKTPGGSSGGVKPTAAFGGKGGGLGLGGFTTPPGGGGAGGGRGGNILSGALGAVGSAVGRHPVAAGVGAGLAVAGGLAATGAYMMGSANSAVSMQQALFQGGLAAGQVQTGDLDRFSRMGSSALGKFQTSVGSAQRTVASMSAYGFSPDSAAGKSMLQNVGGISMTTGMTNEAVGNTLSTQMTNPHQSNMLRLLGIESYEQGGAVKDPGKLAYEIIRAVYPTQNITSEMIQKGLRPGGPLTLMLDAYIPDAAMKNILRDQMWKVGLNKGKPVTNSAAEIGKLGLGDAKTNPNIARSNLASAESNVVDLTRNSQVTGYAAGTNDAAGLTETFRNMAEVVDPLTQNFARLNAQLETFLGTKPGGMFSGVVNFFTGGKVLGGDDAPNGVTSTGASPGKVLGGETSFWPTMNAMDTSSAGEFGVARAAGAGVAAHTHKGIDVGAAAGSGIFAWRSGTVVTAVDDGGFHGGAGNYVEVQHSGGYLTRYLHIQNGGVKVQKGQSITGGQLIGQVGNTGNSSSPHLHFEIRSNGTAIDPWPVLQGGASTPSSGGTAAPDSSAAGAGVAGSEAAGAGTAAPAPASSPEAASPSAAMRGVLLSSGLGGVKGTASSILAALGISSMNVSSGPSGSSDTGGRALGTSGTSSTAPADAGTAAAGDSGATTTATGVKGMVQQLAAARGWTGAEWTALEKLVQNESAWNPSAQNPTSTAFGLFQFLNSTWAGTGFSKSSDPQVQTEAGLKYIASRYGTPSAALAAWNSRSPHWYDEGGWLQPGTTLTTNRTRKPEAILTDKQWGVLHTAASRPGVDADELAKRIGEELAGADEKPGKRRYGRYGSSTGIAPQVTIQVQLTGASDSEAMRLVNKVKEVLEEDDRYATIGMGR